MGFMGFMAEPEMMTLVSTKVRSACIEAHPRGPMKFKSRQLHKIAAEIDYVDLSDAEYHDLRAEQSEQT